MWSPPRWSPRADVRPLRHPLVQRILSRALAGYLRLTLRSIRWRHEGRAGAEGVWDAGGGVIVCFQHGRIALSPACWPLDRAQEPRAMISLSADGQFVAGAVERLGFPAIRGGAGKAGGDKGGASAFRETLRWIKGGGGIAITPDGPRGPLGAMTEGPPLLAKASGAPVLLVGLAARPCLRLKSWDRHVIPLPFARGAIAWAGPLLAPRDADAEALRQDWRARLQAVTDRAEAML